MESGFGGSGPNGRPVRRLGRRTVPDPEGNPSGVQNPKSGAPASLSLPPGGAMNHPRRGVGHSAPAVGPMVWLLTSALVVVAVLSASGLAWHAGLSAPAVPGLHFLGRTPTAGTLDQGLSTDFAPAIGVLTNVTVGGSPNWATYDGGNG